MRNNLLGMVDVDRSVSKIANVENLVNLICINRTQKEV
jgi:hypothetical protein